MGGIIVYKVIDRFRWTSCIATGQYTHQYLKGQIVSALEGTLGLFCFVSKADAERFCKFRSYDFSIIKVRGMGKPIYPKKIIHHSLIDDYLSIDHYQKILRQSLKNNYNFEAEIPEGTVCFKKVEVLE